ncbi:MAG TPA: 50S ribosomal protein L15, partial [Oligoflexia bacterium]|nr:50S ribosomal protein L15 [Oligoflexia bacterium]
MIGLSNLSPVPGSRHRRKRLGLGEGSGSGKTCGRGGKGQTARSGGRVPRGFEGGQMPLHRRLPKVGFTSRKKLRGDNVFTVISTAKLMQIAQDGAVTLELLRSKGLLSADGRLKVLGGSAVEQKLSVEAHAVSASAKEAIEKAGG